MTKYRLCKHLDLGKPLPNLSLSAMGLLVYLSLSNLQPVGVEEVVALVPATHSEEAFNALIELQSAGYIKEVK